MGSNGIFRDNKMEKNPLPKISLLVQIGGGDIQAPLCFNDAIQILLKLAWIEAFSIQAYLRGI